MRKQSQSLKYIGLEKFMIYKSKNGKLEQFFEKICCVDIFLKYIWQVLS